MATANLLYFLLLIKKEATTNRPSMLMAVISAMPLPNKLKLSFCGPKSANKAKAMRPALFKAKGKILIPLPVLLFEILFLTILKIDIAKANSKAKNKVLAQAGYCEPCINRLVINIGEIINV